MDELELLEQVIEEIEEDEKQAKQDRAEFKSRYEDLMACAIDELNDEVLRNKLREHTVENELTLLTSGKFPIYKQNGIPGELDFLSGEEFFLWGFELAEQSRSKSMVNVLLRPKAVQLRARDLIVPFERSVELFGEKFNAIMCKYFLPTMKEVELEVIKLQHEYAERDRQREINRTQSSNVTYKLENSW